MSGGQEEEDPDPLFVMPDWIVLTVEVVFMATFLIFPVILPRREGATTSTPFRLGLSLR